MDSKAEAKLRASRWYYANHDKALKTRRAYRQVHGSISAAYHKSWRLQNPARWKAIYMKATGKRKTELLAAYGNACTCCGERHRQFLTVEHIRRDGHKHRLKTPNVYADLKRRKYPKDGFTILCFNCNLVTRQGDPCPHRLKHTRALR
jgi:hypothetical protein